MTDQPQLFTSASHDYNDGRIASAEDKLNRLLSTTPDYADALHLLGLIALQKDNIAFAAECLTKSLELDPSNFDARAELAPVLRLLDRPDDALTQYRILAKESPDSPETYYNLANVLAEQGDANGAIENYRQAIALRPDLVEALFNLGNVYQGTEQWFEAIACYEDAINHRHDLDLAHTNCGYCQKQLGLFDEAADHYRTALRLDPENTPNYVNLANALFSLGQLEDAKANYRIAIERNPDYLPAHLNLHACLYADDNSAAAVHCLEQVLRLDPDHQKANFYWATIHDYYGDTKAAKDAFEKARRGPTDIAYLFESWSYVRGARSDGTQLLGANIEIWKRAYEQAQVDGLVLEFGVRFGTSIRQLAALTEQPIHGFDTFQGLPERWNSNPEGTYTTRGQIPSAPDNVEFHVGLFADTLPGFIEAHRAPIRFMNVDCDLYSSTKAIFDQLADLIVPGTVIVFDDYLANPLWQEDEHKAFVEAVASNGWTFEYLAFSLISRQAAAIIR